MNWLNPIAIWGLTALVIPILIHLWSKNKTREIAFGSIQFLTESSTRQSKRIQLSEIPLLLLRLLILICTVLLLAKWLNYETVEKQHAVLLGEGLKVPQAYSNEQTAVFQTTEYEKLSKVNHWYLLEEFGIDHPEIDSLIYINEFDETDFVGAIPKLNFHLKLKSSNQSQTQNSREIKHLDTLLIHFDQLNSKQINNLDKVLKANELYVNTKAKFKLAEKDVAKLIISNSVQKSAVNQIVFTDTISSDYLLQGKHNYSLLYISNRMFESALQEDQFLMLVSEYMAKIIESSYQYASFEAVYSRNPKREEVVKKASSFSNELLWIIAFLIFVERYLSYRKQHA